MLPKQRVGTKSRDGLLVQQRRVRIERARLGQRKEPLDVIVDMLEVIWREAPDLLDRPPAAIDSLSRVKSDELFVAHRNSTSQGRISRWRTVLVSCIFANESRYCSRVRRLPLSDEDSCISRFR